MSTTIKIGHASMSESGTAIGVAGDSTGKEVYIVSKYTAANISPYVVLRPKTSVLASKSVTACIAGCNNNNIGYSQNTRNTLYTYAKAVGYDLSQVSVKCNTDCSAFMTVCALAGGAGITYGTNAPTTGTMKDVFVASGDYTALTDSKYTTKTDYLQAGDILVSSAKGHTVMVLENGVETNTPSVPDTPGIVQDLDFYNIISKVSNITSNSCNIEISLVDWLNKDVSISAGMLCSLEYKKLSSTKYTELPITNRKIRLQNLTEDTCYIYRVKVGDTYYSAHKTFNTVKAEESISNIIKIKSDGQVCAVYIKTDDVYLPATIHINT